MKQNCFCQDAIFQRNQKAKETASKVVSELKQLDSLRTYASIQASIIQTQDSIMADQGSIITYQKKQIHEYQSMVINQNIGRLTAEYKLKKADERIQELEGKKPKRGVWYTLGAATVIVLKILAKSI